MAIIDITGKVALVTGGSRGAGQAVCLALARAGCDVAINYATRAEGAEETSRKVQAEGRRSFVVQADVSRADAVAAMVRAVEAALGGIDILINRHGRGGWSIGRETPSGRDRRLTRPQRPLASLCRPPALPIA